MDTLRMAVKVEKPENNIKLDYTGLSDVEEELKLVLSKADGIIKDMCISLLKSGGKRIRPIMVMESGLCFSSLTKNMLETAVAAELIHMASLVHDDIIDLSECRRGSSTINSIYGNHAAVLVGDFLFAEAFSLLSSQKLLKSMGFLVEAIQNMCDGEINQAGDKFRTRVTINDYFTRIAKKTGILISSCCKAGAAAADAPNCYMDAIGDYGMNVGYAFQIMDDILDFTGDEKKLGKPAGRDLVSGNITLPVILLLEDKDFGLWAQKIIEAGKINKSEMYYINELLYKSGALRKSMNMAKACISEAKSSLYSIPDSIYRDTLLSIADNVISRES